MLALMQAGAILVPFTRRAAKELPDLIRLATVERLIEFDAHDQACFGPRRNFPVNPLVGQFRATGHPGLIVFTSGSTGTPKAILHDFARILNKYAQPRAAYRTLLFLLFDHFGGVNTFLSVLSFGGVAVIPMERTPGAIARLIEAAHIELLPVTPTFLRLLLASGSNKGNDLSSVKLITYGTEMMPEPVLARLQEAFPCARLQQTYGLSEVGVLGSRSRESGSLWVRVGGAGFETRVVDGVLHIRSEYAMVGYLNAPSPFDADGWMNTGDVVTQEGEWLRFLGRATDIINVGGQKVFPGEVENVLIQADNVLDATVYGEKHPLTGSIVVARVTLSTPEDSIGLRQRLRAFCLSRLEPFKVPVRFLVTQSQPHSSRFKKSRPSSCEKPEISAR